MSIKLFTIYMQFVYAGYLLVILYKVFVVYRVYSKRTQAKEIINFRMIFWQSYSSQNILVNINMVLYMQPHTWQRSSDTHFELAHFKKDKKKKGDQPGVTNHISQGQQAHMSGSVCVLYPLLCKVKIKLPQLFPALYLKVITPKCHSPNYMYMYFYTHTHSHLYMYMCTSSKNRPFQLFGPLL